MKTAKLAAVGGSAFLLCVLAAASAAQDNANRRAPAIRVYSTNGSYALETTSYVTPVIEVGENAYVFAVAEDVDGQIQVLSPDFPGISVRMVAHKAVKLPNFFAGFSTPGRSYLPVMYSGDVAYDDGFMDSRGTVIALASRAPFNLERIASGGDWNISAIRNLIENRTPSMAAQALANYLGAKGEPIGRDYLRFSSGRRHSYYALDAYSQCDLYYGYAFAPTLAFNRFRAFARINALRRDGQVRILGYDLCGTPIVAYTPSTVLTGVGRRPPVRDTTGLGRPKLPRDRTGRPHPQSTSTSAAEGVFPLSRRGNLPQIGDVTITAPRGRRTEPGQVLQGYRPQPGISEAPRRVPIERVTSPRMDPQPTGTQQPQREPSLRELRPEPQTASPPPSRTADPPRQSPPPPAPRPSTPAPPPPRVEATMQKTSPPPANRQ
ncbi:MAG: hypothetical protein ACXU9O_10540 [Gemmatimonadaceae bacterium]